MFRKNNSDPSTSDWQTSLNTLTGSEKAHQLKNTWITSPFDFAASQWVSFHVLPHFRLSPFICRERERDPAALFSSQSACMSRRTQLTDLPRIVSSVFPVRALALDAGRPSAQSAFVDRVEVQLATLVSDLNSLITLQFQDLERA